MSLELPADPEVFADDYGQLSGPAVYALDITRPADLGDVWDRHYDNRPEWFDRFRDASAAVYVGAAANVLARLEDHRDGEVRKATLPTVAADVDLRNVWFFEQRDRAFERESNIAIRLRIHLQDTFVRSA